MAVTAADAVAAAYLADAAAAGPSAVARRPSAAAGAASAQVDAAAQGEQQASDGGMQQQRQEPQRQQGAVQRPQQGTAPALLSVNGSRSSRSSSRGTNDDAASAARPLEAGWWPTFVHSQLGSTRQLQRFTNAVVLQRWLYRQYRGVVDIYEDRLQLWAISGGGRRLEVGRLVGLGSASSVCNKADGPLCKGGAAVLQLVKQCCTCAT